ncbi:MAG: small, acid-soluble spore protein, alpha/beta type [Lachnospiraceae bacterium]|nr:small, acid-soluble spore protein, alpha/beta type [Lachnospiraceae bacterium]
MKKKIEVKEVSDIAKLKKSEQAKWELAVELGLFDRVVENGWKSLTARESGKIGGILSARKGKGVRNSKMDEAQKETSVKS